MVKRLLKRQFVSSASYALRASLGTRFTRTQVTPRSSALNAAVEDDQMFQMVIPTSQSLQRMQSSKIETKRRIQTNASAGRLSKTACL
ncbi:hypothetical protein XS17_21720 [Salmonella enterica subsp. enterica]|nr:hypothetical protein [Salmonella enterica subsp. enterica]